MLYISVVYILHNFCIQNLYTVPLQEVIKLPISKHNLLHSSGSAAAFILSDVPNKIIENEQYKTNTNLFMNINNNTAPFVSVIMIPKGTLALHCILTLPNYGSYSKCIHCCCLPCTCVTKPFGILQRIIKSQKVCISFGLICLFRSNEKVISYLK